MDLSGWFAAVLFRLRKQEGREAGVPVAAGRLAEGGFRKTADTAETEPCR